MQVAALEYMFWVCAACLHVCVSCPHITIVTNILGFDAHAKDIMLGNTLSVLLFFLLLLLTDCVLAVNDTYGPANLPTCRKP